MQKKVRTRTTHLVSSLHHHCRLLYYRPHCDTGGKLVAKIKIKAVSKVKTIPKTRKVDLPSDSDDQAVVSTRASKKVTPVKNKATDDKEATSLKRKRKSKVLINFEDKGDAKQEAKSGTSKKRKSKEEKEAEAMPLAPRTQGLKMMVGAHVSMAKGIQNSVTNALHIGANAFALFLKSQRKWANPALKPEDAKLFTQFCKDHQYEASKFVLPHGSYLVNLAQAEEEKAKQAYDSFVDDLKRCESLGIKLYNFHPGSPGGHPRVEAIGRIAAALNRAHAETTSVIPLLENMASPSAIGSSFEDLRDIIALIKDKTRIGVCLDTCHAFAYGYDLRTVDAFSATLKKFDSIVGLKYLKALHLNDSKAPFSARRDLHQNIGVGFLGLRAFHNIMNEKRFEGLPMVLETPIDVPTEGAEMTRDVKEETADTLKEKSTANIETTDTAGKKGKVRLLAKHKTTKEDQGVWTREIKLLESLIGLSVDSKEFLQWEAELSAKGAEERATYQLKYEQKVAKEAKSSKLDGWIVKGKKRGAKKEENDGWDSDGASACSHG
jgi:AP endonuclease 1